MTNITIQTTSLYFREGNSDKEYHASIKSKDDGYLVTFAYGRRGNTLTTGIKTQVPVALERAQAICKQLVASKLAKGYTHGEAGTPYQEADEPGRDTGIHCQLSNPIEPTEIHRLIRSKKYCLQQKFDGRRLLVRKQGDEITGINRRGLVTAIPDPIRRAFERIPFDVLIDGEAVGDTLHAFDLLEVQGRDLRQRGYIDRHAGLLMVVPLNQTALRWVRTAIDADDKLESFEALKESGGEGVVFKNVEAPFSPGRPNRGGPQLKFKFVESASFVVTGHNEKRSVTIGVYEGDVLLPAGNVTIPPNHAVPAVGEVCECRYLFAYRQSGSIYQPVYLGRRCDIPQADCTIDQLKYKAEPAVA